MNGYENLKLVQNLELDSETIKRLQAISQRLTRDELNHFIEIQNKFKGEMK